MKLIKKENHEAVEATVITDQGNRTPCPLVIFQESGPCTGTAETYSPEQWQADPGSTDNGKEATEPVQLYQRGNGTSKKRVSAEIWGKTIPGLLVPCLAPENWQWMSGFSSEDQGHLWRVSSAPPPFVGEEPEEEMPQRRDALC